MSTKEVKDAERGPHEAWCDTQNMISERCNCMASSYIDQIDDHLAAMAEKDAEIEKFKRSEIVNAIKGGQDYGYALDEIANLKQTIATQERVIEKLTEQRNRAADRHHKQSLNKYLERIEKFEAEIAAIEKAGAKDE